MMQEVKVKPVFKSRSVLARERKEDRILAEYEAHVEADSLVTPIVERLMKKYGYFAPSTIYRILNSARERRDKRAEDGRN